MSRIDEEIARHERIKMMRDYVQSYIDDADEFIPMKDGAKIPMGYVVEMINDMFLYFNEGEELTEDMKVKT